MFASGQWVFLMKTTVLTFAILTLTKSHVWTFRIMPAMSMKQLDGSFSVDKLPFFHGIFYFEVNTFIEQWNVVELIDRSVSWSRVVPVMMQGHSYCSSYLQLATWWRCSWAVLCFLSVHSTETRWQGCVQDVSQRGNPATTSDVPAALKAAVDVFGWNDSDV